MVIVKHDSNDSVLIATGKQKGLRGVVWKARMTVQMRRGEAGRSRRWHFVPLTKWKRIQQLSEPTVWQIQLSEVLRQIVLAALKAQSPKLFRVRLTRSVRVSTVSGERRWRGSTPQPGSQQPKFNWGLQGDCVDLECSWSTLRGFHPISRKTTLSTFGGACYVPLRKKKSPRQRKQILQTVWKIDCLYRCENVGWSGFFWHRVRLRIHAQIILWRQNLMYIVCLSFAFYFFIVFLLYGVHFLERLFEGNFEYFSTVSTVLRTVASTPWGHGGYPHFYKWLGTEGAPWVEQQTRNWPNCTDHHKIAHQND